MLEEVDWRRPAVTLWLLERVFVYVCMLKSNAHDLDRNPTRQLLCEDAGLVLAQNMEECGCMLGCMFQRCVVEC